MERSKMSVLVVDDNANMRRTVRHMLSSIGFTQFQEAPDGDVALRRLATHQFDLVVCDWNMPNVKGIEVLKSMRKDEALREVPFLMVTAEVQEEIVAQAAEGEVDGYVIKPFTAETLGDKIDQILRKRSAPDEMQTLFQLAEVYRKGRMTAQAQQAYEQILAKQPTFGPAMLGMSELAADQGKHDDAEAWLKKAIEAQPRFVKAHDALARLYERRGDEKKRLECLQTAARLSPLDANRQLQLAETRLKTGDAKGAQDAFMKAKEVDPEIAGESNRMAEALLSQGHYDEAVELFEVALERDPAAMQTYNRMGIAYRRQKRYGEAIALYERALKASPDNPLVLYNRGCAYLEWSKLNEARASFRQALQIDPEFAEARKAIELLGAAVG